MCSCKPPILADSLVTCNGPKQLDNDDDDDDDYTFPIQGSGVCIDQRQYKVPKQLGQV